MNTNKNKTKKTDKKLEQFLFHLVMKYTMHPGTLSFDVPLFTPVQQRHPAGHSQSIIQNVGANELWQ